MLIAYVSKMLLKQRCCKKEKCVTSILYLRSVYEGSVMEAINILSNFRQFSNPFSVLTRDGRSDLFFRGNIRTFAFLDLNSVQSKWADFGQ